MPLEIALRSTFATVLCALFMVAVLAIETRAAPGGEEVELERLTWVEVRNRLAQGSTTILIPTGGTEQNGRHMALGKHNFIVRETSKRIARQLGNALVAPVLAYVPEGPVGLKVGHMAFPGTISLPDDVYEKVLENAAWSFKTHGFKRIVFVGDSGGNQGAQQRLAERLGEEWKREGVQVISANAYYADNNGDAFLKEQGLTAAQIGTHAGVRDTSELMAVEPGAVRLDVAIADADGATGNAKLATREFGEQLIAKKVAAAVGEIQAHAAGAPRPAVTPGLLGWLFGFIAG